MSRENAEGAETRKYFNAEIAEIAESEPAGDAQRGGMLCGRCVLCVKKS